MLGVELGEGSAGNWLTLAVRNGHGQAAAVAALFATAFAASEAITRIFGGPLVDRLGRVRTIRVTTALGVVGVVLFILAGNIWLVLVGVLLWAVGVSMGFPLGTSAAAESGPEPGRAGQRRLLDRLFRQPGGAARHRRARPVGRPPQLLLAYRCLVRRCLRRGRLIPSPVGRSSSGR